MSDNGYDIWRDVANILVNPTIETEMGYRVPTRELAMYGDQKFEYYNPELAGGRKQKDDSAAAASASAASAAGEKKKERAEPGSFCRQKSFKFKTLKYHFNQQTNFRDDNDNFYLPGPIIEELKGNPTIETYIKISKFFQKPHVLDEGPPHFVEWCREKYDAIYYYCNEASGELDELASERRLYTKEDKQAFIKSNFPKSMKTNIMKVADLIRVLNFFVLDMSSVIDNIHPLGGPTQTKELPYITQMPPKALQSFINLLTMIDDINGYGPEIDLVKTFDAAKDKFESDRAARNAPAAPSAAAAALAPPDDLASKHYSQRKPNRKKTGKFNLDASKLAALAKRRKTAAPTKSATVRGKCPFCFQDVTTAQKRIKDAGIYYHQDCYDAKSQGWVSRVSKSTGRALYRHSEHSKTSRWEKPKITKPDEDNIFRGGRKTKRKKKKQTKRPKKKQTKRRKTNTRKKKSKKRRK